jgi:large subunit ribosomal protein L29
MKTKDIREKNDEALEHELRDQQKHLFDLRSQAVTEKLEDPSQLLKVRRDIARMKTILRERQLDEQRKGSNGKQRKVEKQTEPKAEKKAIRKNKTVRRTVTKVKKKKAPRKKAAATK